jgi:hypothetical protein
VDPVAVYIISSNTSCELKKEDIFSSQKRIISVMDGNKISSHTLCSQVPPSMHKSKIFVKKMELI